MKPGISTNQVYIYTSLQRDKRIYQNLNRYHDFHSIPDPGQTMLLRKVNG